MSDRPLVVHVVLSLDPGGLERLVCNLAAAPSLSGFRVLVCCLDREGALAEDVRRAGHRVLLVPRAGGTDPGLVLRLSRVFRRERPAVVHTHNLDAMLYAGWAAVLAGVPLRIHTQHNTLLTAGYGWQERLKFRLALPAFRHVVAVSQQTARQFELMGVPAARGVLVRNGVDQGRFQSDRTPAAPLAGEIVVGAVGRLSPEKGMHRLLEAFRLVRTDGVALRLAIVGDGKERQRLEELARQSGIGERVTFLGFRERVHEILPGFQIFVLPSLTEGIPLALLEAMSAGLACIATRVGGVPEVIEDGVNGVLVAGDDPMALARAIEALAADPLRRARLGEAARSHAAREWSEDAMARRYRALYRAEAAEASPPSRIPAARRPRGMDRVAVICHFPPPPGGMPSLAALLVRRLRAEGLMVLAVRTNLGAGRLALLLDGLRGARTLLRIPVYLARLVLSAPRVRVLHVFSHSGLGFALFTVPAVILGRLLRRRVVVNYHGGHAEKFLARYAWFVAPVLRAAHVVSVPSDYLRQVFARHDVASSIVHNVAETDRFSYREGRNPFVTVLVARHLEPIYNVACAVRAFARVHAHKPGARLVLLGDGAQREELQGLVATLGLGSSVTFAGYVQGEELIGYYERASVMLNTSNVDNVPMAILEAYAAGLPLVSTRAGGIPSIVEDGRTGFLVDLDDHTAAADRVLRLLDDQPLADQMARKGHEVAVAHGWTTVFAELLDVYGMDAAAGR